MSNNIQPLRPHAYVAPSFNDNDKLPANAELIRRVRHPIRVGAAVIGVAVVGLGLWASLTPISSGVSAPGQIRVEANRKVLRYREGGTVRAILVKEGSHVKPQQVLLRFDDVQARANADVTQNAVDVALAQSARYLAEATGKPAVEFPAELTARLNDPRVAGMIHDQQFLFTSRQQLFESQGAVLNQRLQQQADSITGLQAQLASIDEQARLTKEQLTGYQTLFEKGYASKNLILRYQASMADLAGKRGQMIAEIAKTREQMGETRMQLGSLRNQRQSEAADGLREMQSRLADGLPKLTAARQTLQGTVIRSPVDGYVFNLSQHTVGGVAGAGEPLMEVVPDNSPLIVTAQIKPQDVDEVHIGMPARVRLSGLNQRWTQPAPAEVVGLSADRLINEKTGEGYFLADLRIDSRHVGDLPKGVKLSPGMPADAMIVTGKRTVMGFLISPITDTIHNAFREE
ncbi:HlyD family type I secretion periplasmic adaptor subunit [Phenylobacterium sp.]|jgi:HlyD family type I secretion membrane fusion protein|uniref:HlyD family type I secretion periplasmic adaptor subunit n=1 Tax=Phenylobacterium sp. TaxID=1871053 RepID=UPI002F427893